MVNRRDDPVMALCVLREGMIGGDYSVEDIGSGGIRITRGGVEIRQTEVGSKLRFLSVRQTVVNYNGKQQVVLRETDRWIRSTKIEVIGEDGKPVGMEESRRAVKSIWKIRQSLE